MQIWKCDRCNGEFTPFTFNVDYYLEPPQILNYDLCERCFKDVYSCLTKPVKWFKFHFDKEMPELGQTIELYCPEHNSASIIVWSEYYENHVKGGGYALYEWRPWKP